jgi:uncharacterized membrane protein
MRHLTVTTFLALACTVAGISPVLSAPPQYTIKELGPVSGINLQQQYIYTATINDHQIVAGTVIDESGITQTGPFPFIGPLGNLNTISNDPIIACALTSFNNYNMAVGNISYSTPNGLSTMWRDGVTTLLPTVPGFEWWSTATAINSDGEIAGYATTERSVNIPYPPSMAYLFKPNTRHGVKGSIVALGNGGDTNSEATGINDAGEVCGSIFHTVVPIDPIQGGDPRTAFTNPSYEPYRVGHAFVWIPDTPGAATGQMVKLDALGTGDNSANAINKYGVVVGTSENAQSFASIAFKWTPDAPNSAVGTISELPVFADQLTGYAPSSINNKGQIVGSSGDTAVLWQGTHIYNLNKLIPPNSFWHLAYATTINNNGQIVCYGWHHHVFSICLLTPVS